MAYPIPLLAPVTMATAGGVKTNSVSAMAILLSIYQAIYIYIYHFGMDADYLMHWHGRLAVFRPHIIYALLHTRPSSILPSRNETISPSSRERNPYPAPNNDPKAPSRRRSHSLRHANHHLAHSIHSTRGINLGIKRKMMLFTWRKIDGLTQ